MTTIRELCERKQFELAKFVFERYKGTTPMCCVEMKNLGKGKDKYLIRCEWLKEWLPEKEFKVRCRKCQKEIAKILKEQENED